MGVFSSRRHGAEGQGGALPDAARATPDDTKASRTASLIAMHELGQPRWTPRDYAALAREGYTRNPVAYRCVRMIAEAAASVPLQLFEGRNESASHPLLRLLARPNPRQAGRDLMEALYGHLLVAGNAYLELVAPAGEPMELHALRPDRMRVVPGRDGWPQAYDYVVNGRSTRIKPDPETSHMPILHLTLFHPLDDHYGFAPIEAAQTSLDIHNAAGSWNKALLDNAARPSGALVYNLKGGNPMSDSQFERLKRELEEGFQGTRNAGRPLLLEGGLQWQSLSLSPKDMDFIDAKNTASREIALAFGVPPMLLGIPGDNTFANYQEANRALWRQTVLPLVRRSLDALTHWLAPFHERGEPLALMVDSDGIEALTSERDGLWKRLEAASFLTEDEKRAAVGYGPRQDAEAIEAAENTDV